MVTEYVIFDECLVGILNMYERWYFDFIKDIKNNNKILVVKYNKFNRQSDIWRINIAVEF